MSDAPSPRLLPWSDDLEHALELRVEEAQPVLLDLAAQGIPFYVEEGRETVLASEYVDVWVRAEDVERAQELANRRDTLALGFDPNTAAPDDDDFDVPDLTPPAEVGRIRALRLARLTFVLWGLSIWVLPVVLLFQTGHVSLPPWWPGSVVLFVAAGFCHVFVQRFSHQPSS